MKTGKFGVSARMMASAFALGICVTAGTGAVTPAYAQPKPAKPATPPKAGATAAPGADLAAAKKHYGEGEKLYRTGDYAGALTEFKAADEIKATPQSARYVGLCLDGMGRYTEAVAAYERFLADVPKTMAAQGDQIRERVEKIKAMPGRVHIETTPPGATATIDGKPAANPTPTDVDLAPGKHTVVLSAEGRETKEEQIDVAYASKQDLRSELAQKAAPPPEPVAVAPIAAPPPAPTPPPAPAEPRSKVPAFVTLGLAVVGAGVGTAYGLMALNDKKEFDNNLGNPSVAEQKAKDGDNHALIADMAFAAAFTLGVTSAVLFLSGDEPQTAATTVQKKPAKLGKSGGVKIVPTPYVTPNGGGAGAFVNF